MTMATTKQTVRGFKRKNKPKPVHVNTDLLRIDGRYYAVKRIQAQEIDIDAELKEIYDKRHEKHISMLNDGLVAESLEDWGRQIKHLQEFGNKGSKTYTIPPNMNKKPVMVHGKTLIELRCIVYAPDRLKISRARARNYLEYMTASEKRLVDNEQDSDKRFMIHVKPSFAYPLLIGYSAKHNQLYTPTFRTFHTFSGGDVCTSGLSAKLFWDLNDHDLAREI
jgi:hypothetical protein